MLQVSSESSVFPWGGVYKRKPETYETIILPVVSMGLGLSLRKGHLLWVLKIILGTKREEMIGCWRKLYTRSFIICMVMLTVQH
jgi:hypothetical protein